MEFLYLIFVVLVLFLLIVYNLVWYILVGLGMWFIYDYYKGKK